MSNFSKEDGKEVLDLIAYFISKRNKLEADDYGNLFVYLADPDGNEFGYVDYFIAYQTQSGKSNANVIFRSNSFENSFDFLSELNLKTKDNLNLLEILKDIKVLTDPVRPVGEI